MTDTTTTLTPRARRYGWRRSLPDFRDRILRAPRPKEAPALPPKVDLRRHASRISDQGELGSCVGHAVAAVLEYEARTATVRKLYQFSELFIYLQARIIENTVDDDAGCEIRDAVKACAKVGAAEEKLWPYVIDRFAKQPPAAAYTNAAKHKVVEYRRVPQTADDICATLASGHPVVFGIMVYDSFESDVVAKSGIVPMPATSEKALGGHALALFGYDRPKQRFLVRNSWSTGWGLAGYCWMPFAYLTTPDLADDLWAVSVQAAA